MTDLVVSNDTEIIAKVQKTAEILMIFKVHTYGEQTVVHVPRDMISADRKGRYQTRRSSDGSPSGAAIHIASGARLSAQWPS